MVEQVRPELILLSLAVALPALLLRAQVEVVVSLRTMDKLVMALVRVPWEMVAQASQVEAVAAQILVQVVQALGMAQAVALEAEALAEMEQLVLAEMEAQQLLLLSLISVQAEAVVPATMLLMEAQVEHQRIPCTEAVVAQAGTILRALVELRHREVERVVILTAHALLLQPIQAVAEAEPAGIALQHAMDVLEQMENFSFTGDQIMGWNFEKNNPSCTMPDGTTYTIAIDMAGGMFLTVGLFRQRKGEADPLLIDHPQISDFGVDETTLEKIGVDQWLLNVRDAANLIIQADYAAPPAPAAWDASTPKPWLVDNGTLEDYINAHLVFDTTSGIPVVKKI